MFSLVSSKFLAMRTLQSLTGKYREIQGKPCNENRDPAMRTGFPCNESRFFPMGIDLQGVPCKPYRVWVYSVILRYNTVYKSLENQKFPFLISWTISHHQHLAILLGRNMVFVEWFLPLSPGLIKFQFACFPN